MSENIPFHIVYLIVGIPWMGRLFHPAALMHLRIG